MDRFLELAEDVVVYQIRKAWLELSKLYNEIAAKHDMTLAIGFTLLTINPDKGTQVTKIAPRMGMEPNSLSRLLKTLEQKELVYRRKDSEDKRKVYICLTDAGKEKRKVAYDVVFNLHHGIIEDIVPEKLEAFFEVMQQVHRSISSMKNEFMVFKQEHENFGSNTSKSL